MASRSPEATAPAGSGASPGGLGTALRACVASHVPPVAITNPPVLFRKSRRDGIAPPKGQTTFSVARAEPNTRIRKRGLTPIIAYGRCTLQGSLTFLDSQSFADTRRPDVFAADGFRGARR